MPSPSLILSVALAASFVPLSNLSRSYIHKTRKSQMQPFADTLAYLAKDMRLRLLQERVVPEVIADAPPRPVAVFYPYATVLMGNEIHSSALRHVPKFSFDADPDKRYSLVFLGPDYPSRSNPYERNHVLWFVTNYARNSTHEVRPICRVSYGLSHLTRNSGRQRFVFLVYEQPDDTDWSQTIMDPPTPKINFMLDSYVSRNRLTLAAVNYFIVDMEKEATGGSGASDNKSTPSGRITDEDKESDCH
ncbi:hypothetical protein HPB51_021224 [Rhipicephalus microplus]|uniref:Uncharacterized protein n=1 Tax=Rhipicephalus microplus TaxID=6941 RepID=A0A9J6F7Q1_RHIMP|nr:hypothetical protein HPB51_021224 [Rhipicephalus microplus]